MKDGVVQQVAAPMELYDRPANRFVAGFIGTPRMNFWPLRVRLDEGGSLDMEGERLRIVGALPASLAALENRELVMGIRPDDIPMSGEGSSLPLHALVRSKVDVIEPLGSETLLYWRLAGATAISRTNPGASIHVDQEIEMELDLSRAHFFDAATGESLLSWPSRV